MELHLSVDEAWGSCDISSNYSAGIRAMRQIRSNLRDSFK